MYLLMGASLLVLLFTYIYTGSVPSTGPGVYSTKFYTGRLFPKVDRNLYLTTVKPLIPLMSRNACNGENGKNVEKSPEGWRFKLDSN